MEKYLHCFDLSDRMKYFNFYSRRVIESLFSLQLIINDNKPNPRNIAIQSLIDCDLSNIDGLTSPRMMTIYQASIFRKNSVPLTEDEQKEINKADLEIEFEKRRREINYDAPSRLSCIYLVEDNLDGRNVLQNMFVGRFLDPLIVEVKILNNMGILKCDHRWLQKYYDEPKDEYIINYWTEVSSNEMYPSWEYLLEGMIELTCLEQINEIDRGVKEKFPEYYEQIKTSQDD